MCVYVYAFMRDSQWFVLGSSGGITQMTPIQRFFRDRNMKDEQRGLFSSV